MIITRKELKEYLFTDGQLYPKMTNGFIKRLKNRIVTSPQSTQWYIYSYLRNLRYSEYHLNNSILRKSLSFVSVYHTVCLLFRYKALRRLSFLTGFQIDPGSFGKGLMIYHYSSIVVNAGAKIGDYATIYPGVVIGAKENGCPTIGHHCFIGAGSKILGGVKIGNHVTIAPNAVVVKDVPDYAVVGGVPAKIIKIKDESTSN